MFKGLETSSTLAIKSKIFAGWLVERGVWESDSRN